MQTGFELYIVGGIIIAGLFSLAWRALGRHTTVNNTVSPTVTATASSDEASQSGVKKNLIGGLISAAIAIGVILFAFTAIGNYLPAAQPAQVTEVKPEAVTAVEAAPIVVDPIYAPIELPRVPTLDIVPLVLLIAAAAMLYVVYHSVSRKKSTAPQQKQMTRVKTIAAIPIGQGDSIFDQAAKRAGVDQGRADR